jgi:hypothetical protein
MPQPPNTLERPPLRLPGSVRRLLLLVLVVVPMAVLVPAVSAAAGQLSLSVTSTRGGQGTVSGTVGSGGVLSCSTGSFCSSSQADGAAVTLHAAAQDANSKFAGWGAGVCQGTPIGQDCSFTISGTDDVNASFIPTPHLTVNLVNTTSGDGNTVTGTGGINCPGTCMAPEDPAVPVTLTATAGPSSVFEGWSGCGSTSGTTCTIQSMEDDATVTATFAPKKTLTVATAGSGAGSVTGGAINCPGICSGDVPIGTQVTLTATPATGSDFSGWTGCDSPNGTSCTMTLSDNKSVTATFTLIPRFDLGVSFTGSGSGTVVGGGIDCPGTCTGTYLRGTTITLTATPDGTSTFVGWQGGGCSGTGTCTVTMSSAQAVVAGFAAKPSSNNTGNTQIGGSNANVDQTNLPGANPAYAGKATVSGTTITVPLTCKGPVGTICAVTVSLTVTETLNGTKVIAVSAAKSKKPKTRKKTLALGHASANVKGGTTKRIAVKVNAAGLKLLATEHRLPVLITITERSNGKTFAVGRQKRLVKPVAKHKKTKTH